MERELTVLVVWVLVASSYIQCFIHFRTWWILHNQKAETNVGDAMNLREFTLGIKAFVRGLFDILLAVLVTYGAYALGTVQRETLYVVMVIAAIIAIISGGRYILALREEGYGHPDGVMNLREKSQNVREAGQNEREHEQNDRDARFLIDSN